MASKSSRTAAAARSWSITGRPRARLAARLAAPSDARLDRAPFGHLDDGRGRVLAVVAHGVAVAGGLDLVRGEDRRQVADRAALAGQPDRPLRGLAHVGE